MINFRQGQAEDSDWLFLLFRETMQDYIDDTWGWDELLQREGFLLSLPAKNFRILEFNSQAAGGYHITKKDDHVLLDMIIVKPEVQGNGLGRLMMNEIQEFSQKENKPIHLSVLKTNPAIQFHVVCGFQQVEEDNHSVKMVWS